jgi:hypothetical protein
MRINENFSFDDENEMWKYWNTHTTSEYAVIDVVKSATKHNYIIPLNHEISQGMAYEYHYYCIIQKGMKRVNQKIQQFASSPMSGGLRRATIEYCISIVSYYWQKEATAQLFFCFIMILHIIYKC